MEFEKGIDAAAVHLLKGKQGDILRLPGAMHHDCHRNLALQSTQFVQVSMYRNPSMNIVLAEGTIVRDNIDGDKVNTIPQ